ncbi:MAG: uncharacterized protein QOF89_2038 [Acidobacteriota bacterium]|jgi:uncharacterized protein YqgC (DUF456 family)|nr:uncharacterized protein [Acidobacteriota bacterium]
MENPIWLLAILLVLAGIAGTVLPALPGAPLVFLGLLCAAWADHFQKVGWFTLTILAILTVLAVAVDFLAKTYGAKRVGASWLALSGAIVGTIVGLFFSIPGLIFGPFLGAVAGEWLSVRNLRQAGKVGLGTWLGMILGIAGNLALIFAMVGIFVLAYVF